MKKVSTNKFILNIKCLHSVTDYADIQQTCNFIQKAAKNTFIYNMNQYKELLHVKHKNKHHS